MRLKTCQEGEVKFERDGDDVKDNGFSDTFDACRDGIPAGIAAGGQREFYASVCVGRPGCGTHRAIFPKDGKSYGNVFYRVTVLVEDLHDERVRQGFIGGPALIVARNDG